MTFVASDETRDSYGTVLPVSEWNLERYNNNGIVGYAHNLYGTYDADPDYVIGRGRAYVKGAELLVDVEFEPEGTNEIADKVWRKLQFGSLNGVSVGFSAQGAHWGEGEEAEGGSIPTLYYTGLEFTDQSVDLVDGFADGLLALCVAEGLICCAEISADFCDFSHIGKLCYRLSKAVLAIVSVLMRSSSVSELAASGCSASATTLLMVSRMSVISSEMERRTALGLAGIVTTDTSSNSSPV